MNMQIYDNKYIVEHMDLGLYSGEINVSLPVTAVPPRLNWHGTCIDRDTFRLALAFLKWTHDHYKIEGQARFWYNETTREWRTVVLPQEKWNAGHTREVEEAVEVKEAIIEALINDGFGEAGTIHHHSNMSAFQSGGDKTDELSRSGFHVTVGQMSSKIADFHARATFKGINYEQEKGMMSASDWMPGMRTRNNNGRHKAIPVPITEFWLSLEDLPEFPEVWKEYVVEQKAATSTATTTNQHQGVGYQGMGCSPMSQHTGGRQQSYTRTKTPGEINKEIHRHDTPVYKDKTIVVWLRKEVGSGFQINVRLPKAMRDAISASTKPVKEVSSAPVVEPRPLLTAKELRQINTMSPEEFSEALAALSGAGKVDCSGVREDLAEKVGTELALFRDEFFGCHADADDLEDFFKDLQRMTTRFVRTIEITSENTTAPSIGSEAHLRDLVVIWMARMSEIIYDLHPEEWAMLTEACVAVDDKDRFDFYGLMTEELIKQVDYGFLEDKYFADGTVTPLFVEDIEIDAKQIEQSMRRRAGTL